MRILSIKFIGQTLREVAVLDKKSIQFTFNQKNPELHMIIGDIPVFSKKWFNGKNFSESILDEPIASGPYIISKYETGRFIEYKKNPNYWAKNESYKKRNV